MSSEQLTDKQVKDRLKEAFPDYQVFFIDPPNSDMRVVVIDSFPHKCPNCGDRFVDHYGLERSRDPEKLESQIDLTKIQFERLFKDHKAHSKNDEKCSCEALVDETNPENRIKNLGTVVEV